MIKNIVFDMGKVLVGYDADRVCSHFFMLYPVFAVNPFL